MESEDCSQIYETIGGVFLTHFSEIRKFLVILHGFLWNVNEYNKTGFGPGPKPPPSVCSMSSSKHDGMIR